MPKLPIKQSLFIFANIFLILSFFMEKKWPLISLLNEYMKNLVIPFLTIIITIQLSRENRQMAGDNRQLVGDDLENRPLAQENLQINGDIENSQLARNDYQIEGQNDPLAGDNHQLGGENPQLAGENTLRNNANDSNENSNVLAEGKDGQHEESESGQAYNVPSSNCNNFSEINKIYKKKNND